MSVITNFYVKAIILTRKFPLFLTVLAFVTVILASVQFLKTCASPCLRCDRAFDQAYIDSFGFFDDIDNLQWQRKREIATRGAFFLNNDNPDEGIDKQTYEWMMNNAHPVFTCPYMMRVGGMADGGKWVCDPHRIVKTKNCLIYSVGSHGQYEFEDEVNEMMYHATGDTHHCEIHVFDPNPKYRRENDPQNKNIHFHEWGIKSSYTNSKQFGNHEFHTFQEIVKMLGHTGRRIDLFKFDCEGCEWTSYEDLLTTIPDIRQLLIEIHPIDLRPKDVSVSGFFEDLRSHGFVPFSKEANTLGDGADEGVYEYSFIRLKFEGS